MLRRLRKAVAIYLLIGLVFALAMAPEQVWACPDPSAPHGHTTGNFKMSEDCRPTVTAGDGLSSYIFGTAFWLPLVVGKALAPD